MVTRRNFLSKATSLLVFSGVILALGQFFRIVLQYLYPQKKSGEWFFVLVTNEFERGRSIDYVAPEGQSVVISRIGSSGNAKDFIALSNVCPHLGCKVHWEGGSGSFFCPCHNGRFNSLGAPTEGPPAKAGQKLITFPLKVESGILYIQLPSESLTRLSLLEKSHRCSNKVSVT